MKTIIRFGILFLLFSFSWGCSCSATRGGGGTGVGNPPSVPNNNQVFYNATLEVMPVFAAEESSISLETAALTTSWGPGNPLYEVFYNLQEFDPGTEGIDISNLHKMAYSAQELYSQTKANCSAITVQEISPPFNLGNENTTYNCAFNYDDPTGEDFGGAIEERDEDGNIIEMTEDSRQDETAIVKKGLFGFIWLGPAVDEYGVMQGSYNATTGDLSLDLAFWADEESQSDHCLRHDIDGNAGSHLFAFRSMKTGNVDAGSYISLVGSGYSQGEGRYFLLKIITDDMAAELGGARYYCIPVGSGEAELRAMNSENPAGSETVAESCADLQEQVDALPMFTAADLACEASKFNPGGTDPAEGTIFLNFEE